MDILKQKNNYELNALVKVTELGISIDLISEHYIIMLTYELIIVKLH